MVKICMLHNYMSACVRRAECAVCTWRNSVAFTLIINLKLCFMHSEISCVASVSWPFGVIDQLLLSAGISEASGNYGLFWMVLMCGWCYRYLVDFTSGKINCKTDQQFVTDCKKRFTFITKKKQQCGYFLLELFSFSWFQRLWPFKLSLTPSYYLEHGIFMLVNPILCASGTMKTFYMKDCEAVFTSVCKAVRYSNISKNLLHNVVSWYLLPSLFFFRTWALFINISGNLACSSAVA